MMTQDTTTPAPATAAEPKTVGNDMKDRRVFSAQLDDSGAVVRTAVEQAQEYLAGLADTLSDFGDQTFAARGIGEDADGNPDWDATIYTPEMDVMVSRLREKGKGVKAIVIAPVPSIDSLLSDASGQDWVQRILHKELNHVAVRALREASDISTVIDQMPTTRDGYINSARDASGIMETFNELYKAINATLSKQIPVWAKRKITKNELKRAMESTGYAAEYYAAQEDYKGESLFVAAIKVGIASAKRKGMDPTIFERWLASRDQKVFKPEEIEDDEDELDIDSLTDALLASEKPATDATAATETPTTDTAPQVEEPAVDSNEPAAA